MNYPKLRALDGEPKAAAEFLRGEQVVGLNAQIQRVHGVHTVTVSETRRIFRVNGFLVLGDQMLWTADGWAVVAPEQYRFYRALRLERVESLKLFMEPVIAHDKLRILRIGGRLLRADGSTEEVTEVVDVTPQNLGRDFVFLVTDGSQSVEWESGHVSECLIGLFHPEAEVMDGL